MECINRGIYISLGFHKWLVVSGTAAEVVPNKNLDNNDNKDKENMKVDDM